MDPSAQKPKQGKRVRFFIDPTLSDAEIDKRIMEITVDQSDPTSSQSEGEPGDRDPPILSPY